MPLAVQQGPMSSEVVWAGALDTPVLARAVAERACPRVTEPSLRLVLDLAL